MKKHNFIVLAILLILLSIFGPAEAVAYAKSYTYSIWGDEIPAPDAYVWKKSVRAEDLGIDAISNISEIYCANNKVYIALDKKIVITDNELNPLQVITEYVKDGEATPVLAPTSVFATKDGHIYIAEQDKGEIIEFDQEGSFVRSISNPKITGLENVKYAPTKVVVDDVGRIYVKAKSVYEGIIELNPNGEFNRFLGAVEVKPDLIEIFYRSIATDAQISRMELWLPTDYSDIALDKDGYLMATVRDSTSVLPIRKLNSSGADILTTYEFINPPMGDYANGQTISTLLSIATAEDGRFGVIDTVMSRVFVYSSDGILAYNFGGKGKREGEFSSAVDMAFCGEDILVADLVTCSIEVFTPTEYGRLINTALRYQGDYDYETAAIYWKKAYEIYPNSVLVNMGLGKYQLRSKDYEGALRSFEATGERTSYSAAFEMIREAFLEKYLIWILFSLILFFLLLKLMKAGIRRFSEEGVFENKKSIKLLRSFRENFITWPGYMLSHPFKAFDDIKYQDAGSTKTCVAIMILFAWMKLIMARYMGFMANFNNVDEINVLTLLVSAVGPYLIFVVANWAIGVLIDGKGTLKSIFKVNMYALYPSIFMYLIATLLSHVVTFEELAIVQIFQYTFPIVTYVFYVFIGLVMVHQYSFTKGIFSVLLSIIAMLVIIFVTVLLFTLASSFINDVGTIIDEILLYT